MVKLIGVILAFAYSAKFIEYQFSRNFGQIIFDYSGNGRHGSNGDDSSSTINDILATDRGAYFSGGNNKVLLPTFSWTTSFTIILWVMTSTTDCMVFYRYKIFSTTFNISRLESSLEYLFYLKKGLAGLNFYSGGSNTFLSSIWQMISLTYSAGTFTLFQNNVSIYSTSYTYTESGTYSTAIGSYFNNALIGFVWYFAILDDLNQNPFISVATSTNCLTLSCNSCNPAIVDPTLGTGCVSLSFDVTHSASNQLCTTGYGCANSVTLNCPCASQSCGYTLNPDVLYCITLANGITTAANGISGYASGGMWHNCYEECLTCTQALLCTACISSNAFAFSTGGCKCNVRYWGTAPLTSSNSCSACYQECSTCSQANLCDTCLATNASPFSSGGCRCNPGYYGTFPLTSILSCSACHQECATCSQANTCDTCKSTNASPSATQGCQCNTGYFGSPPLINTLSCTACYQECATCSQASLCVTCISSNASPLASQGCRCDSGYFGTAPLTDLLSCTKCDQECTTCSQANLCDTCIASNASPSASGGCNCNDGYFGASLLLTVLSCTACYQECATCSQANVCDSCKTSNASPFGSQGCACDTGYFQVLSLTSSTACAACNKDCATCSDEKLCLTCLSPYAIPLPIQGCSCLDRYFGVSPLDASICTPCHEECSTCSNANLCDACIALNASPSLVKGCKCNAGFWGTLDLVLIDSCTACYQECSTCSQASLCDSCIAFNASPFGSQGCRCNAGYFGTFALIYTSSCTACYQECSTCSQANACITCVATNASPFGSLGCRCNTGYYGTSPLTSLLSCTACNQECSTCSQADVCETCIAANAVPLASQGCGCSTGYGGTPPLNTASSCVQCFQECATCSQLNLCETCIAVNSHADSIQGCKCNPGFWGTFPLITSDGCKQCFSECASCTQDLLCNECQSLFAVPDSIQGCKCIDGYWAHHPILSNPGCKSCNLDCMTCLEANTCLKCKDLNALPSLSSGCLCNDGFYKSSDNICVSCNFQCFTCSNSTSCDLCKDNTTQPDSISYCSCKPGYYNISNNPILCSKCPNDCITCYDPTICLECALKNSNPQKNEACTCPDYSKNVNQSCVCDIGYFMTKNSSQMFECYKCSKDCSQCLSDEYCLTCANSMMKPNDSGKCELDCKDQIIVNNTCVSCPYLCKECDTGLNCVECTENSTFNGLKCLCNEGYEQFNGQCIVKYFVASIQINSANAIQLMFSEQPSTNLNLSNFFISIENATAYIPSMFIINPTKYLFFLNLTESIDSGTAINITININTLYSTQSSLLKNNKLYGFLNAYDYQKEYKVIKQIVSNTRAVTQSSTSSSIGIAIVSNPALAWTLINTIQLITYLSIGANPLSNTTKAFCSSIGGYNILPNYMSFIFNSNSTSEPYPEAQSYGISTSVFWINMGPDITILSFLLLILPFIYLLSQLKIAFFSKKFGKLLQNYRYSVFLRFWMQAYLDAGFFSLIQLKSNVNVPEVGFMNTGSATICIVKLMQILVILSPFVIFTCSYISFSRLKDINDLEYKKRFGPLFMDFKNDKGFFSTQYYFIYFLRRLGLILSQVYLNRFPQTQAILNIVISFSQIPHLIYYRPFKDIMVLISNFSSEICVIIVYCSSYAYLYDPSLDTSHLLDNLVIFSVIGGMTIQVVIIIISFILDIKVWLKKIERHRINFFLKSAQSIIF